MSAYWQGKSVVVTGGARGQGRAEVLHLLKDGATVFAVDVIAGTDPAWSTLHEAAEATGASNRLIPVIADIGLEETWKSLATEIENTGNPLWGLVNNAGITLRKTVTQTALEEWERVMRVNLTGAYLGIHTLAPRMSEGGSIVNVSSVVGMTGYFSAAYTASKWALRGLTRAASLELAVRNIRVNTVCPGLIDTPMVMTKNAVYNENQAQIFYNENKASTPLGRGALPAEVADLVMYLLGPNSSFITGADIPIDGGMTGGGIYWRIGLATGTLQTGS